jgi:type I restriction enzyme S subunit
LTVLAQTQRLGDLCDVVAGGTPPRTNLDFFGGNVPWVKIGDMLQGHIRTTDECLTEEGLAACRAKVLPPGTLLVSIFATIGRTAVLDIPAATNQAIVGVMPRDRKVLDPTFLRYFLDLHAITLGRQSRGVAQNNINASMLKDVPVPIPFPDDPRRSLAEQKRIAAILDKADAIRRRRQEAARLADTLIPSVFYEMFGDPGNNKRDWPVVPLSHFVAELQGGKNIATDDSASPYTKHFILKVSAVTWGEYLPEESKPVPPAFEPPEEFFVREGDLLITRANTRELIGATAYVSRTPSNMILPDKIWRFVWRSPSVVEPLFVHHLLKHPVIRAEIGQRASGTSGSMKNISMPKLLSVNVPLPPLELQRKFSVVVLEQIELQQHSATAYREADAMFNALVQRAFRGEL